MCIRDRFTTFYGTLLTLLLVVIWPSLALPARVFSRGYFTFWTILSLIWGLVAAAAMIFLPVAEAKDSIITTAKNIATGNKTAGSQLPDVDRSKHSDDALKKKVTSNMVSEV